MKKRIIFILKISLTFAVLVYIFNKIPLQDIGESLATAKPACYLGAFLIMLLMRYLASYRMKLLTAAQKIRISTWQLFEITLISNFYVQALPGNLAGGAIRWYRMNRVDARPAEALASIAYDRLIDTVSVVLLGTLFWFLPQASKPSGNVGIALAILLTGMGSLYATAFSKFPEQMINVTIMKWHFVPALFREKVGKLVSALHRFQSVKISCHVSILAISLLKDLIGVGVLFLFSKSLDLTLSFATLGWVRAVILGIGLLPFAFSGLGVREGSLVVLLRPYGVEAAHAVAFSFLFFLGNIFLALLGGLIEAKIAIQKAMFPVPLPVTEGITEK